MTRRGEIPEAADAFDPNEHMPLPAAWGDILGDTTVAAAMLDRLLHRSVVINLDGDSYRLREHQARNEALRKTTTGTRTPLQ